MSQALSLAGDLKLGWYTSIPPREMFAAQIIGTVLGALANCQWLFHVVSPQLTAPPRCHTGIGDHLEETLLGWNSGGPDWPMDRASTRDILLGIDHLGRSRPRPLLCRQIRLAIRRLCPRRCCSDPHVDRPQALSRVQAA